MDQLPGQIHIDYYFKGADTVASDKKKCETCGLNENGCKIDYQEGFKSGGCGCWIERKE